MTGGGGVGIGMRPLMIAPPLAHVDAALLFGRIAAVVALIPNAMRKIATFEETALAMGGEVQMIAGRPFPDQTPLLLFPVPELFLGASILFDLLGTALIVLGWRTRHVAAFMAFYVFLAMAIYHSEIRHAQDVILLLRNLPFLGSLVMLAALGGGHWSLDGRAARISHRPPAAPRNA